MKPTALRTLARSAVLFAAFTIAGSAIAAASDSAAPLGSPNFLPSPERPVGWRGDGTGRYPAATPPTTWSRTKSGAGYTSQGILWTTPLPNPGKGVSSPILVGDRIFLTAETDDLLCIDKQSGHILWIRSNSEFEGLPAEERQANPAFAEKLEPLAAQLAKANDAVISAINSQGNAAAALKTKSALEKQIKDAQIAIDPKKFERNGSQSVYGFSGPTPTSDGKHVLFFNTTGITACYDLAGKRLWIDHGPGSASEHGNFSSPVLIANRLITWSVGQMRAFDVDTGKIAWSNKCQDTNSYGSLFRLSSGGESVAAFQSGFFARVSDGKPLWNKLALGGGASATPIVEGNAIIAYNDGGFRIFKIPPSTDSGKISPSLTIDKTAGFKDEEFANPKSTFNKNCIASPLFVDGLIYRLSEGGGLAVNDAATGAILYTKVLPMKSRTEYWSWGGASISPGLAGKYIYLIDNQGTTVVVQPGKEYKQVAVDLIEESLDGKTQTQNLATPVFEGSRMYYRSPSFLYCIGEK